MISHYGVLGINFNGVDEPQIYLRVLDSIETRILNILDQTISDLDDQNMLVI